jgi:hypothetical protein
MMMIISEMKHQNGQKLHEKVLQKKERKKKTNATKTPFAPD